MPKKKSANPKSRMKRGEQLPQFTILPDHPVPTEDTSQTANFEARLSAALDVLRHRDTLCPIAIAIYGDWGTGKTSAMRWLQAQLEAWSDLPQGKRRRKEGPVHPKVYSVWFDPWKYHSREDVWRGLIAEIILHCISVSNLDSENFGRRLRTAASRFGRFLGKGFLDALSRTKIKSKNVEFSGEAIRDVVDEFHKVNHPEKAYLNDFESTLREWIDGHLGTSDRLTVFIDDLDRCMPDVALEVLEALKLYLNVPQLAFVVGLDRQVVDAVVRKHYAQFQVAEEFLGDAEKTGEMRNRMLARKSEKYLDKMFQVEIDITPSTSHAKEFIDKQIAMLDESTGGYWSRMLQDDEHRTAIEDVVSYLAEHNPREIKRLLNSTLMRASEAANDPRLEGHSDEHLRFAQGAQVFLMQRVVRRDFVSIGNPFMDPASPEFFAGWAGIAMQYPDHCKLDSQDLSDPISDSEKLSSDQKEESGVQAAFAKFAEKWKDCELIRLLNSGSLRRLMAIPYQRSVAESAPIEPIASGSRTIELNEMPAELIERIANQLGKPVAELELADLAEVEFFSLHNTQVSDVSALAKLTKLTELSLNATPVSDVSALAKLTNLTQLYLLSTPVSDVSALANLTNLTQLYLHSTPVSDVSALAKLTKLTILDLQNTHVSDISALAKLTNLTQFSLRATPVSDVSALAKLTNLTQLYLDETPVSDVSALAKLTNLTHLDLRNTQLSDVSALAKLSNLTQLSLRATPVSDVSALAKLTNLTRLDLDGTEVSDVSALAKLTNLTQLSLRATPVSDVSALAKLTNLTHLYLHNTPVSDVSALAKLTNLTRLDLDGTQVSDVSALAKLTNLTHLDLRNTQLSDVSALAKLTNLTHLYLHNTPVSDVSALAKLTNLTRLYLQNTQVSDVSALAKLTNLTRLYLQNTQVSDVSALAKLTNLNRLDLRNTQVSDVSALAKLEGLRIVGR